MGVGCCNPQTTFNFNCKNYKMQYITDALTIDVLLSPVRRAPSSFITSSYPSPFLLLTPVLFTNELPGCSLSLPPVSAASDYFSPWSWNVCSDKAAPYLSPLLGSITRMDMNADHDFCFTVKKQGNTHEGQWGFFFCNSGWTWNSPLKIWIANEKSNPEKHMQSWVTNVFHILVD